MRKLMIVLMLAVAMLAGCGDDDGGDETAPENLIETADDVLDEITAEEFVIVDGGERLAITQSCVDSRGAYKGQIDDGGIFILRGGGAPTESFIDFQPSADADPLSSQSAEDTVLTQEGTLTTGTTTVTTQDGANSLELRFQLVIREIDPNC